MKYPSILLGAVQSCMKRQSVVEALITSPSVDRDVNFKSSTHTEISIKFIPSVKGLNLIISKFKQAAGLELGILREKVVLYKTGKLLQASVAPIACKFKIKKN